MNTYSKGSLKKRFLIQLTLFVLFIALFQNYSSIPVKASLASDELTVDFYKSYHTSLAANADVTFDMSRFFYFTDKIVHYTVSPPTNPHITYTQTGSVLKLTTPSSSVNETWFVFAIYQNGQQSQAVLDFGVGGSITGLNQPSFVITPGVPKPVNLPLTSLFTVAKSVYDPIDYTAGFETPPTVIDSLIKAGGFLQIGYNGAGIDHINVTAATYLAGSPISTTSSLDISVDHAPTLNDASHLLSDMKMIIGDGDITAPMDQDFQDSDPGDTLNYLFYVANPIVLEGNVSSDGKSLIISGLASGSSNVTVLAIDPSGLTVSKTFKVTVKRILEMKTNTLFVNIGQEQTVPLTDIFDVAQGHSGSITSVTNTDPSSLTVLSWTASQIKIKGLAGNNSLVDIVITAQEDNNLSISQQLHVIISPALVTFPKQTIEVGDNVQLRLGDYFHNPVGGTATYGSFMDNLDSTPAGSWKSGDILNIYGSHTGSSLLFGNEYTSSLAVQENGQIPVKVVPTLIQKGKTLSVLGDTAGKYYIVPDAQAVSLLDKVSLMENDVAAVSGAVAEQVGVSPANLDTSNLKTGLYTVFHATDVSVFKSRAIQFQVIDYGFSDPGRRVNISDIVAYLKTHQTDLDGDGVFDQEDIYLLLHMIEGRDSDRVVPFVSPLPPPA